MIELENIVARMLYLATGVKPSPTVIRAAVAELESHADEVRTHMDRKVWGISA